MNYGFDEDQDLDQWMQQQAQDASLSGLLEPEQQPMAAQFPGMPGGNVHMPPQGSSMPDIHVDNGPDWTDALGAGTTALAAIADLAGNHGRGTGQILSAGNAFGQARAEQRLRGTQDMIGYEEKRAATEKSNRYNDYLMQNMVQRGNNQQRVAVQRDTSNATAARNATTKETAEGRQGAKVDRDTNADSEYADQFRNMLYDSGAVERGKYDGASYEQMKADQPTAGRMWEFQHAGDKAKATASGRIEAEIENGDAIADLAGDKAANIEAKTRPGFVERAKEGAKAREDVTGNIANREGQQTQARMNKFRDETEKSRPQIQLARAVENVMSQYPEGDDAPGAGMWDSFKSNKLNDQDAMVVRNATQNMTDLVARVRSGAAVPPPEFESIARFVDGGTGATEQEFRIAWAATVNSLKSELLQQAAGRDADARTVLGSDSDWALGAPPVPVARGAARGGMANATGDGGLPRAIPLGNGMFQLPGGHRPYNAQEVQQFIQMGKLAPQ